MSDARSLAEAFEDVCMLDGPLDVRLAAYASKLRELNFPFAEAYDDLVARLYVGEVGTTAPAVGDLMPPFDLPSKTGTKVTLEELVHNGPVVISLNRGHWCPFCQIELRTLATHHRDIAALGAQIVSIMPERQNLLVDLRNDESEPLMFLADINNGYALSLGLVMWVGNTVKGLMQGYGVRLDVLQGNDGWFLPVPATFVVDADCRVIARFVDPDFRKRMNVEEIVAALHAARSA